VKIVSLLNDIFTTLLYHSFKSTNKQTNKGVEDYYKSVSIQTADYLQQYFTIKGMWK